MKSTKKNPPQSVTYAIYGMMEYVMSVKILGHYQNLHFSGGCMSGYGVRPATYTTSDELMQNLIEQTDTFRSGKIKRLNYRHYANPR